MKVKYNHGMVSEDNGYYPEIRIDEKTIPELKDKKVGDVCELMIKVEITGINSDKKSTFYTTEVKQGEYYNDKS